MSHLKKGRMKITLYAVCSSLAFLRVFGELEFLAISAIEHMTVSLLLLLC